MPVGLSRGKKEGNDFKSTDIAGFSATGVNLTEGRRGGSVTKISYHGEKRENGISHKLGSN